MTGSVTVTAIALTVSGVTDMRSRAISKLTRIHACCHESVTVMTF